MHFKHISAKIQLKNLKQHFDWGSGPLSRPLATPLICTVLRTVKIFLKVFILQQTIV